MTTMAADPNTTGPNQRAVAGIHRQNAAAPLTTARVRERAPVSVYQTIDADRNGTLADPLPAGSYSGDGPNAITVEHDGGRNGAYGPAFFKLDLRTGYTVAVANGRKIELFGEIFNVTNRANFANPSGDRSNANFLRVTGLSTSTNPHLVQIGARYSF